MLTAKKLSFLETYHYLRVELGRHPSQGEIAERLGIKQQSVSSMLRTIRNTENKSEYDKMKIANVFGD